MTDDQFSELKEIAYKTKETVSRLESNWEMDRKDFSDFQNRLGHLEVEFKTLRDQIAILPRKTSDQMEGMVGEIRHEAQGLKDAISDSKVVSLGEVTKSLKRRKWYFLFLVRR